MRSFLLAALFAAQLVPAQAQAQDPILGRVSKSTAGVAGQRQSAANAQALSRPLARVTSRVPNRIELRLRSRIDSNYDPQANARSPFALAEQRSRAVGRPPR
jgi:hypothetical protein